MSRPYFGCSTEELRQIAIASLDNASKLHTLYAELVFRERRAARQLRDQIARELYGAREWFQWPTTDAPEGQRDVEITFPVARGLLGFMGYQVGARAATASRRQGLLADIFQGDLPSINSQEYMEGWGAPSTGTRLSKIAESIAAFARNAQRRDNDGVNTAVGHWKEDLAFLRSQFYEGRFNFPWPAPDSV